MLLSCQNQTNQQTNTSKNVELASLLDNYFKPTHGLIPNGSHFER